MVVIKLDEIGDFVLATPFMRELRRNAPQAEVFLVVKPAVSNLAETCPYVNRVLVFDWRLEGKHLLLATWRRQWRVLRFAWQYLRYRRLDAALIPRLDLDSYGATQMAVCAGPGAVVAYSEASTQLKSTTNRRFDRLLSHVVVPPKAAVHEVEANLAMIEQLGGEVESSSLELWLTEDDRAFADTRLDRKRSYVAIAAEASRRETCWPAERFAKLATWLRMRYGLTPIILGTHAGSFGPDVIDFAGQTTLRQAAAILSACILLVGNDTGLKHLAAAVSTPVVEINACRVGADPGHPRNSTRFRAWGVPQRVVRPPPGPGELAIGEVEVGDVQSAVAELLHELDGRIIPLGKGEAYD